MPTHHHSAGTLSTTNAGNHNHWVNDPGHNHGGFTAETGSYGASGGDGIRKLC